MRLPIPPAPPVMITTWSLCGCSMVLFQRYWWSVEIVFGVPHLPSNRGYLGNELLHQLLFDVIRPDQCSQSKIRDDQFFHTDLL